MKTRRWMATFVVALLSVTVVLAKDIRVVVFKVSQMHCENCEKKVKEVAGRIQEVQLRGGVCERNQTGRQERRQTRISKRRKESR